jgi:hypothetical protein
MGKQRTHPSRSVILSEAEGSAVALRASSVGTISGAPCLDSETWESNEPTPASVILSEAEGSAVALHASSVRTILGAPWQVSASLCGARRGNSDKVRSDSQDHSFRPLPGEAIYVYKALLVSLTQAFDLEGIDRLLFPSTIRGKPVIVSGDGILMFSRLVASDLAKFELQANNNGQLVTYSLKIPNKGRDLIRVWKSGNR